MDIPGIKALSAAAEASSVGLAKVSSAAGRVAAVALVPVNIVNTFAQVAAAIVAVTPTPIRIVVGWVWNFVPSFDSPFVVVIMVVQLASDIQWYKRMANLLWKMMTGSGREAACNLCDEVVVCFMHTYIHECMYAYIHTYMQWLRGSCSFADHHHGEGPRRHQRRRDVC